MGVTWDMMTNWHHSTFDIPDMTWLGGALAGLKVYKHREPVWAWTQFMDDVRAMQSLYDIETLDITQAPENGSLLDVLGGYVSVTGSISAEGLSFPIPFNTGDRIKQHLIGMDVTVHAYEMTIPLDELDAFTTLISLRGPVEEMLGEVKTI